MSVNEIVFFTLFKHIFRSSQCSTTGVTKAIFFWVCVILSVWYDAYKRTLAANHREKPMWQQQGSSCYINGPLPYV